MEKPFAAYKGAGPYVFVCHAHDDQDVVYPEIGWLHDQGINLWYDEGISGGKNWREVIGDSLLGALHVLFYISDRSLASDHCNREISLALDEGKNIVPVYLEDVELTSDLKVGLNRVQAIHRVQDQDYQRHLVEALGNVALESTDSPSVNQPRPISKYAAIFGLIVALAGTGWWYLQNQAIEKPGTATVVAKAEKPTIAVLPFDNLTADVEQEYFSDGVAEDILNGLAANRGVVVRSRYSSFSFKREQEDVKSIAEQLKVTHIVSGSVRVSDNTIRVNARLTSVEEDVDIWTKRYDRQLSDVFAVQDEVTGSVLAALNLHFSGSDRRNVDADAYNAYLLGRYHRNRFDIGNAIPALEKAIALDPEYAAPHATLVQIYELLLTLQSASGEDLRAVHRAKQRAHLQRALEINPEEPLARAVRAGWLMHQERIDELDRIARGHPSDSASLFFYAHSLYLLGKPNLALQVCDHMVAMDPLNPNVFLIRGQFKLFEGDYDGAYEDLDAAERLGIPATVYLALAALAHGDIERLRRQVDRGPSAWASYPQQQIVMAAAVRYLTGDATGVAQILSKLESGSDYVSNLMMFWSALLKGHNQLALDHMRAGLVSQDFGAYMLVNGTHGLRSLFPEYFAQPGFETLLREFDLDSESLAKLVVADLPF